MKRLRKYFGYRTLKTALGAALAIYISQMLNLSYAANSGIIVIISVQCTKKRSMDLAIMRIGSTVLALLIGTIVFSTVGFTSVAFGIYLLLFIPIATRLKFNEGIVPCSVLVSHILAVQSVSMSSLSNEMMQMIIGAGIGFLVNLHMPSLEKKLEEDIVEIEKVMKKILINMADCLRNQKSTSEEEHLYKSLELRLMNGYGRAINDAENQLVKGITYHVQYMENRKSQFEILNYMRRYFKRLYKSYEQTEMVATLTELIAEQFHEMNTTEEVFTNLKEYKEIFRSMKLPETRDEFENRATLYEYINDLEHLLEIKRTFVGSLTYIERKKYKEELHIAKHSNFK